MHLRKPKSFTIDRSKWVQGKYQANGVLLGFSELLNEKDNMCCLGFYSEACGVPRSELQGCFSPKELEDCHVPYMVLNDCSSSFASDLMQLNDNSDCSKYKYVHKRDKEKLLKEKFKLIDVKVKFVGRYPRGVL